MSKQLIIFKLDNEDFGIEITQIKEIIKPPEIFKVPDTPYFVEGLINLRGKVHTVFNLRKKFHLTEKVIDDMTKIIIANVNNLTVGFVVDEVNEIIKFNDDDIEGTPKSLTKISKNYIDGVAKKGEKIVLKLNLVNILTETEYKEIEIFLENTNAE